MALMSIELVAMIITLPPCLLSLFALIISFNSIILTILYINKVTLYLKL